MARPIPMRTAVGWDPQLPRMVGFSATAHVLILFVALVALPLVKPASLPIVAYTVELVDPNALGGRMAPGRPDLPMGPRAGKAPSSEGPARQGEPAAQPEPPKEPEPPEPTQRTKVEPPAPVEPPVPIEPAVKLPSPEKPPPPKPEAKKAEPKPAPPRAEPAKPEANKAEPAKPEAKKAEVSPPEAAKPATKPVDARPAVEAKPAGKPGGQPDGGEADGDDAYASAASKWRTKGATGGGGGLGGTDTADGPMGTPGYGAGGGQLVGFEFLAYQQRVVSSVKGVWSNAMTRPGLLTKVRFRIAPSGDVSAIRIEQSSGDTTFDGSTLRAVERANPLPPPPARYVNEFREFVIEFHSEDEGGRAAE